MANKGKKPQPPVVTVKRKEGGAPAWLVRVNGTVSSVCSYAEGDREGERTAYRDALAHKDAVLAEWKRGQKLSLAQVAEAVQGSQLLPHQKRLLEHLQDNPTAKVEL